MKKETPDKHNLLCNLDTVWAFYFFVKHIIFLSAAEAGGGEVGGYPGRRGGEGERGGGRNPGEGEGGGYPGGGRRLREYSPP